MLGRMIRLGAWPAALCGTAVLLSSAAGLAASPGSKTAKASAPTTAPKLEIPKLSPIPKADGAVATQPVAAQETLKTAGASAQYSVVSVHHLKRGDSGNAPLSEIAISGSPPSTPLFRSVIRVKCSQKMGAPIEVVVLDPRSDTVMTASGQFHFATGKKGKGAGDYETEYTVDWEPTPWPRGGAFRLLVRVAGQPMGTWPLTVKGLPE